MGNLEKIFIFLAPFFSYYPLYRTAEKWIRHVVFKNYCHASDLPKKDDKAIMQTIIEYRVWFLPTWWTEIKNWGGGSFNDIWSFAVSYQYRLFVNHANYRSDMFGWMNYDLIQKLVMDLQRIHLRWEISLIHSLNLFKYVFGILLKKV